MVVITLWTKTPFPQPEGDRIPQDERKERGETDGFDTKLDEGGDLADVVEISSDRDDTEYLPALLRRYDLSLSEGSSLPYTTMATSSLLFFPKSSRTLLTENWTDAIHRRSVVLSRCGRHGLDLLDKDGNGLGSVDLDSSVDGSVIHSDGGEAIGVKHGEPFSSFVFRVVLAKL